MAGVAFVAHVQSAEAAQPGESSLNNPPVAAESFGRLDAFAGDAHADSTTAHPAAELGGVICLVRVQLPGLRRRGPRRDRITGSA